MGCFLYFVPQAEGSAVADDIEGADLGDRLPEGTFTSGGMEANGPCERRGWLVARLGKKESLPLYNAETQTWRQCEGGKYWLGYVTASPPGPGELEREEAVVSWGVILGDKNRWFVPSQKVLPAYWNIDDDGEMIQQLRPAYTALSKEAGVLFDFYMAKGLDATFEMILEKKAEMRDLAIRALALNYRVTKWEVAVLGLLDDSGVASIVLALFDVKDATSPADEGKKKEE